MPGIMEKIIQNCKMAKVSWQFMRDKRAQSAPNSTGQKGCAAPVVEAQLNQYS
jgi:hypothetical protein